MAVTLYDEQGRAYPTEVIRVSNADVRLLADNTVMLEGRTSGGGSSTPGTTVIGAARGVFPIQDYNAALDGVTDDTDAWNRAVYAAWQAGGGVVQWLESGTSIVNKVRLRDNVTLRLGDQSTLKLKSTAVGGDFVLGNFDFVGGNVGVSVEGGRYDGNSAAFAIGPNITTMQFQNTPRLSLRDCYVTGGIAEGVYVFNSTDVEILGLTSDHCGKVVGADADGSGLHVNECSRVKLTGVSATYCGFHGVFVNGCQEVSGDVYVAHNNIDNIRVNAGYAVNLTVNSVESVQRGLYLNLGCYGCSFSGTVVGSGWHGVVMNESYACQFTGVSVDSAGGFQDVYFLADSDELSFYGRARKTLNEGPATNRFVTGPYDSEGAAAAAQAYAVDRAHHTGTQPLVSSTSGTLTVPRGGTNLTTVAAGSFLYAPTLDQIAALNAPGGPGSSVLTISSGIPSWSSVLAKAQLPSSVAYLDTGATFDAGVGPQVLVLVTGTSPTIRMIAANGLVGGASGNPGLSFRDTPSNDIGGFDVLANNALNARYARFRGGKDRDGVPIPVRLMVMNSAGTLLTALETSADANAGNVLVPNGRLGVGLTGVVQPAARLHVIETLAGLVSEALRLGNQSATVGSGSEIGFWASSSGAQKTASISAVTTASSGAKGAIVLSTQRASGGGPVEGVRLDEIGVVRVADRTTAPAAAPTGGFYMSSNLGVPTFRTSGNNIVNLDKGPAVTAPTGGTVIDVEARAAVNSLIASLQARGLL